MADFVLDAGDKEGILWDDALENVRRRFAEAVERGIVSCTGHTAMKNWKVGARKGEATFGVN